MKLKSLIAALLITGTSSVFAAGITDSVDPALSGASIIDFESAASGQNSNLTLNDVTFSTINNESLYISSAYSGSYNAQGQSLQNTYASNAFNTLNISFANNVNAFGFNFGASDYNWTLSAFDSSSTLIDSLVILPTLGSNAGDFFGLSGTGIASAILTASSTGDYVFIDNFVSAVPEPSTYALMLGGLGLVGFMATRRRRES